MAHGAQHDLNRTAVTTLLEQRFMSVALTQPGVAGRDGWCEQPVGEIIDGFFDDQWEVARSNHDGTRSWFGTSAVGHILFSISAYGFWSAAASAQAQPQAEEMLGSLTGLLPEKDYAADDGVTVRFWSLGPMGPVSYYRRLDTAPWSEVQGNYPAEVRGQLAQLMTMQAPDAGGRLILMHGPPGTGKTHAIRALAEDLAGWCSVDYVIDVDRFFENAGYMVGTMVMDEQYTPIDGGPDEVRWRIVVLEDAGEYLRKDATDKVGLGLGRLLNLADGLVGQGLRIVILMTTNEPVEELHPAVTRPGRCMKNLELGAFPADEAAVWLSAHGVTADVEAPMTLAEMYARCADAGRERSLERAGQVLSAGVPAAEGSGLLRWSAMTPKEAADVRSA